MPVRNCDRSQSAEPRTSQELRQHLADKLMKIVDLDGHPVAAYDELRKDGKPVNDTVGTAFVCYAKP